MEIIRLRQTSYLRKQLETCPKCETKLSPGAVECLSCGALLPKVLAQLEDPMQSEFKTEFGSDFTDRWQVVLSDYENEDLHWNFISYCQQFRALEFAAYRYRRLVDVVNDDIAQKMLRRISSLLLVELEDQRLGRFETPPELLKFSRSMLIVTCVMVGVAASTALALVLYA